MNIDALLLSTLETLSYLESNECECNINFLETKIPFGNIAFINENFWKLSSNYKASSHKRKSHPGLSISSKENKVIFGSSQLSNRKRNYKKYFFVNHNDCSIINKDMVFVFDTQIPATINMIDTNKSYYEPLCEKKMKELKDAGYK